jgi:tripartite ATP-independent transporter DctM subunit
MRVATASVASGGILGGLIPPSTVFIIYGSMTGVSVGQLFFAGIIPGIILTLIFMGIIIAWTLKNPAIVPHGKDTKAVSIKSFTTYIPLAIISVVILGGIYLGMYTVSEAGAIACSCSVLIVAIYRRLSWDVLNKAVRATIEITCMFMIIIMGSSIFSNALAGLLLPHKVAKLVSEIYVNPYVVLLAITVLYVFLGCFIEAIAIMLMTLAVVFPVVTKLGFDPLWFGVVMYVYCGIGCITPPLGTNLYVVMGLRGGKGSMSEVVAGITPFLFGLLLLLIILVLFPSLATWLPSKMFVG